MSDAAANPQTFGATDLVRTLLSTTRKNWLSMFVGGLVVLLLGFLVLLVFGSMSFGSLLAGGVDFNDFRRFADKMSPLPLLRGWLCVVAADCNLVGCFVCQCNAAGYPDPGGSQPCSALVRPWARASAVGALGLAFLLMQLGIIVLEIILVWVPSEFNSMLGVIGNIVNTIVVIAISLALAPLLLVILDGSPRPVPGPPSHPAVRASGSAGRVCGDVGSLARLPTFYSL